MDKEQKEPQPIDGEEREMLRRHAEHYMKHYMTEAVRAQKEFLEAAPKGAVYRHFSPDGELLYVGHSVDPLRRSSEHMNNWFYRQEIATIKIEWYKTHEEAVEAELLAIKKEQPKYNVAGK
jgi:excinuclease UvrABC nuclease subunit